MKTSSILQAQTIRDSFFLSILTCAAVLVHGYHYGVEDLGIYLPAIKKLINPSLYPYDANFFLLFIRWTMFHQTVAAVARVTHIRLELLLFIASVQYLSGSPGMLAINPEVL